MRKALSPARRRLRPGDSNLPTAARSFWMRSARSPWKFRADLFYRLNVFPIVLPTLRDRSSDIPLLTRHFIDKYSALFNRPITSISEQSLRALEQYHWPGNVRELENLVERAVLSTNGAILKIVPPSVRVEPAISIIDKPSAPATALPDNGARRLMSLTENE